jgi:lipoprotein-releasing system permease protein
MTRLELAIAWRYLRSRRGSKLLSLISMIAIGGIVVGVSALVVIIGVMNGLQRDLREKILVGSPDVRVLTYGDDLKMDGWRDALDRVKKIPGVVAAAPFVQTEGGMNANRGYASGVYVVGILPQSEDVPRVTTIREHAIEGDFTFRSSNGERRGVVLGKLLAQRFNAWPGDSVNLISVAGVQQNVVTGGFIPRVYPFEVTGVFETGMYEYDNSYVYTDIAAAQEFAGLGESVTGLEVKAVDRWSASDVGKAISDQLGFPFRAIDWQEQNRSLFQALKLEKLGMGVILLLIVIVAAFNIVSTLTMVVTNKTREIGILKAMGMPARSIRNIFFLQGVVIGAVGTFFGLVIGLGAALALGKYQFIKLDPQVYFIDHLPILIQISDLLLIVVASLFIAAIATIYPSIQAARMYPVDAIRSDT